MEILMKFSGKVDDGSVRIGTGMTQLRNTRQLRLRIVNEDF